MKKRNTYGEFPIQHHRYHFKGIFMALESVFSKGTHASNALEQVMRANKKWGVRERSFVAETTYEIIRYWRLLITVARVEGKLTQRNLWNITAAWMVFKGYKIPFELVFKETNEKELIERFRKLKDVRKIRESFPDELEDEFISQLGEKKWDGLIASLNETPKIYVRVNTLKIKEEQLIESFEAETVPCEMVSWAPEALHVSFSRNMFRTEAFKLGWFEVQDAVSQLVAPFLDVKPGMRVVDGCAGAGGKSLHLGALMKNKGKIISLDINSKKLDELKKRARRAGVTIIEPRLIDNQKVIKRLHNTADRLLLDVPCSGSGVLRRNPDAKWNFSVAELRKLEEQQRQILEKYAPICKVTGIMEFVTCSLFPSEGEKQVEWFLSKNKNWEMLGEKRYSPNHFDGDGFYMCLLKRTS